MDQPKIERLLRLMKLLSSNVDITLDQLAAKLGMSPRTIYRYIDTFKGAGFAVRRLYGNVYKLEQVPEQAPNFDKLVYFSDEESFLVNSLIDKLSSSNTLKSGLKEKLAVIYESTRIDEFVDRKSNAAHAEALRRAANEKKQAILHNYESGNSGTVRDRWIEPFGFTTDFIDVWAYDIEDGHNKVFKIQRIEEVEILEDRPWRWESAHRRQGRDIFRMSGRSAMPLKMKMSIMAKNLLIEEYPLAEACLKREGNSWILDTEVYDYAGACRFFLGLMKEIRIIDSPDFKAYVDKYIEKYYTNKNC